MRFAERSRNLKGQRIEEVFPMIQAPRSLFGKLEIVIPITCGQNLIRAMGKSAGRSRYGLTLTRPADSFTHGSSAEF